MTAIASGTEIGGSGNRTGRASFDIIFPGINTAIKPTHMLALHPHLEAWSNVGLDSVTASDGGLFWQTSGFNIGTPSFLGSAIRAIPTYAGAPGAAWAGNANCTGGTAFPDVGKARCLRGSTDTLPLFPPAEPLLGDNNTAVNRVTFNLAIAIHDASDSGLAAATGYFAFRYTYIDNDPGAVCRGNINLAGEPDASGITAVNHTHMRSIFGDTTADPDLISLGNRSLLPGDTASSNSNPFMEKPLSGFSYSNKIVALVP